MKIVKLVRDNIPKIAKENGLIFRKCYSDEEYIFFLEKKLIEECQEYLTSREDEELADILEVLISISKTRGISIEQLEIMRQLKANKRGSFNERILLEKNMQNK